jgi:hypothetical protein
MKNWIVAFILFMTAGAVAAQTKFSVGQQVEAYNVDWYKAVIKEIGTNNYAGYYKVKYEKYSSEQWIKETNIRAIKDETKNYSAGPRKGRYVILSYGSGYTPITLGYFDLNDGSYIYYDAAKKQLGKGAWSYDGKLKTVQWLSGPFKQANWGGAFEIDREGKTHKVRLNRATIGSNSTDS